MAGDELRFKIVLQQNMDRVLGRASQAVKGFGKVTQGVFRGIKAGFKGLFDVRTILAGGGLIGGLGVSIKKAFDFETIETQFKVLLGNAKDAKARLAELSEFSASTPFKLPEIAKASRTLEIFMGKGKGGAQSLRAIGDAAAAVGQPLEDVTFWVGRAYAAIKGGQPFGEASARLQEMGIVTPQVRQEMERLQKAGESSETIFGVLETRLGEFSGGMKELSTTGSGLISTLQDNWGLALADFGKAFMELAKDGIGGLILKIQELRSNGTIDEWAKKSAAAVGVLADVMGGVFGSGETRKIAFEDIGLLLSSAFQDAGAVFMNAITRPVLQLFREVAGIIYDSIPEILRGDMSDPRKVSYVETDAESGFTTRSTYGPAGRKRETDALKTAFKDIASRRGVEINPPEYFGPAKDRQAEFDKEEAKPEAKEAYDPTEMNQRILAARIMTRVKGIIEGVKSSVVGFFTDSRPEEVKEAEKRSNLIAQMKANRDALGSGFANRQKGFSSGIQGKRLGRNLGGESASDAVLGANRISLGEYVDRKRGQASGKQELGTRGNPTHVIVENMETE